jgi:molecular chaperone GrpE
MKFNLTEEVIKLIDSYKNIKFEFIKLKRKLYDLNSLNHRIESDFNSYRIKSKRVLQEETLNQVILCIKNFLIIIDCLEMGLQNIKDYLYIQGFKLIIQQFYNTLRAQDISILNPLGEVFNPLYHEAVGFSSNHNVITKVVRKGFLYKKNKNILLRPACVVL